MKKRPAQLDSPWVTTIMKYGSAANTWLYRRSGGRFGGTWRVGSALRKPAPVCLLTTTGRRSGQARTVPLIYLRDGANVVLVASQGGAATNPQWYGNLSADPSVTIQIGPDVQRMTARTAGADERAALWPRLVELYDDYDSYQSWTDRTIPVVICEPTP